MNSKQKACIEAIENEVELMELRFQRGIRNIKELIEKMEETE